MRRRLLNLRKKIFSFEVSPNSLTYNSHKSILSVETEYGSVVGTTNITTINGNNYYTLYSGGNYGTTVATLNFVTTEVNQSVSIELIASSEENKDYIAAGLLDNDSITDNTIKLSGTETSTYTYVVSEPGAHYIKLLYRKDASGSANNDRGYFRLIPFSNTVNKNTAPDAQVINITSYGGFEITDKPDWITTNINSGSAGNTLVSVLASLNTGQSRTGTITIKDLENNEYHTVDVSLEASPYLVETTRDYFYESMENGTNNFTVTLTNNDSWSISSYSASHNWFTITPTSGTNNTQVTILWDSNSSTSRSCDVTLVGNNGGSKVITISQEKSICYCDCNNYDPCNCDSYDPSGACTCDCLTKSSQTTGCYCDCNNHNSCKVVYSPTGCPCNCNSVGCYDCSCDNVCAYCYDETCTPCHEGGTWCECDSVSCGCKCVGVCTECTSDCVCHSVCDVYCYPEETSYCSCDTVCLGQCGPETTPGACTCDTVCLGLCGPEDLCPANRTCTCDGVCSPDCTLDNCGPDCGSDNSYCEPDHMTIKTCTGNCDCYGVERCTECEDSVCNEDYPNGIRCYDDTNYCIGKCNIDCSDTIPCYNDCLDCEEGCSPDYCDCDQDYTYCVSKTTHICDCDNETKTIEYCSEQINTCNCNTQSTCDCNTQVTTCTGDGHQAVDCYEGGNSTSQYGPDTTCYEGGSDVSMMSVDRVNKGSICDCDSVSPASVCSCDLENCSCTCDGNCKGECYDETCTPCYDGSTCDCDSVSGCSHCYGETSCAPYVKTSCSCHTNLETCNPHGCNDCASQTYCNSDYVCSCDCENNCGCDGYLGLK